MKKLPVSKMFSYHLVLVLAEEVDLLYVILKSNLENLGRELILIILLILRRRKMKKGAYTVFPMKK
jgi:hypothetical protein